MIAPMETVPSDFTWVANKSVEVGLFYCPVVELANTSDFDSEDCRFEPCRDNK